MSDFDDVGDFHRKFGLGAVPPAAPREIDQGLRDFRLRFLLEELAELADGYGLELGWELRPKKIPEVGHGGCPDCGYNGEKYYDPANHACMNRQGLPKIADALVDLVYVALGTAHMHLLPWPELWADVQRANISKRRAAADGSDSARGSSFDIVKPEGWVPPRTVEVLMAAGWPGPALPLEPSARSPFEDGSCCMARHAAAVAPWTCDCPCHAKE